MNQNDSKNHINYVQFNSFSKEPIPHSQYHQQQFASSFLQPFQHKSQISNQHINYSNFEFAPFKQLSTSVRNYQYSFGQAKFPKKSINQWQFIPKTNFDYQLSKQYYGNMRPIKTNVFSGEQPKKSLFKRLKRTDQSQTSQMSSSNHCFDQIKIQDLPQDNSGFSKSCCRCNQQIVYDVIEETDTESIKFFRWC